MRVMSCSLTIPAVRARTKLVTRRAPDTWRTLAPGDHLRLVEKAMGLPKGARQVTIGVVEVVAVDVQSLWGGVTDDECVLEGFPHMTAGEFCEFWMASHHVRIPAHWGQSDVLERVRCRRIEWRYLDDRAAM